MAKYRKQPVGQEKELQAKKKNQGVTDTGSEEGCRCKEVSKKTPFEMLKLMMRDLAFWKKAKG